MTTFGFRLRFQFPPKSFIHENVDAMMITNPLDNQQIILQSRPSNKLKDATLYDAISEGFSSLDTAISYGQRTRDVIGICCALLHMGVKVGKHEEFFDVSNVNTGTNGQTYIQPNDLNGLVVYPQGSKVEYVGVEITAKSGLSGEMFQNTFVKSFEFQKHLNDKLRLAFELYNSHYFEMSIHAKFLQLISVIECLSKQQRRHDIIIDHLINLVKLSEEEFAKHQLHDGIRPDDFKNFVSGLNNLKRESISSACRNLVRNHLGDMAVQLFKECYNTRSKLIHEGKVSPKVDLYHQYSDLNQMTSELLYSLISKSATG